MNQIDEIAHLIQLSVAPVFLLTGVGTLLNVLSGRLARIIDRARVLEQRLESPEPPHAAAIVNELHVLERRGKLIYHAIIAAMLTSIVSLTLFLREVYFTIGTFEIGLPAETRERAPAAGGGEE